MSQENEVIDVLFPDHVGHIKKAAKSSILTFVYDCDCGKRLTTTYHAYLDALYDLNTPNKVSKNKVVNIQDQRRKDGVCLICGDAGEFKGLGCVCRNGHGRIFG
jgi:hypothetical protein